MPRSSGLQRNWIWMYKIRSWDLSLYDTQSAQCWGPDLEFIASARLDNLSCCFTGCRPFVSPTLRSRGRRFWFVTITKKLQSNNGGGAFLVFGICYSKISGADWISTGLRTCSSEFDPCIGRHGARCSSKLCRTARPKSLSSNE